MYCQKCGKQIEEGSRFCPYCGSKNMSEPEQEREKQQPAPVKKEKKERKKRKAPVMIIAVVVLLILGISIFSGGDSSPSKEELIALVQNGYLGNYDTVTIKEVLEYTDEDAEWNAGEATSGEYYIVEYKGDDITIQFTVNGLEEELFKVSGIDAAGMESAGMEAYDVKVYLDSIYQLYANAHPEKGLSIDTSTANNTLEGHIGPVKAVEESVNLPTKADEAMKDLSAYADYTEDELIQELGYEKNEYGIYPEETHMNFFFIDGKMYTITISTPEDMGMSLCGVDLQDSVEEADTVLVSNGFICEGSFETAELAKDGSLDTVDVSVISYTESATGYPYYIYTDANHVITSLSYGLEAEESLYTEEPEEEETPIYAAEPLTYGTYFYDDGAGTTGTAEVGFYTDADGGNYISIECWQNDREIVYFNGILEADGESYYTYCEDIDTRILVTFADGGLYVQIIDSGFADIESMEGFYSLISALNLNEAG